MFGEPEPQAEGKVKHRPFHSYTMKQAIEEGFILDVLKNYTPVDSYYKLVKKIEDDPEFDTKRAQKKLRRYVESHDHAIRLKAEIMVDHFHEQVLALNKIGGQARAMVVTSGIERAIQYFHAIRDVPRGAQEPVPGDRRLLGRARVRRREGHARRRSTASRASEIADKIQEDPYRFLICADKFQTGYDEPLLHTMYVDKPLSGIKAVQTLSRLNRAHPQKHDCFVLDFLNDSGDDHAAPSPDYYRTTILARGDRPEQAARPEGGAGRLRRCMRRSRCEQVVELYPRRRGPRQARPDPRCLRRGLRGAARRGRAGGLQGQGQGVRAAPTASSSSILPVHATPSGRSSRSSSTSSSRSCRRRRRRTSSKGILEAIDMDSYRVEKKAAMKIAAGRTRTRRSSRCRRTAAAASPSRSSTGCRNILKTFNDQFGNIAWTDADRVRKLITEDIPNRVAADAAYQNAKQNTDSRTRASSTTRRWRA